MKVLLLFLSGSNVVGLFSDVFIFGRYLGKRNYSFPNFQNGKVSCFFLQKLVFEEIFIPVAFSVIRQIEKENQPSLSKIEPISNYNQGKFIQIG